MKSLKKDLLLEQDQIENTLLEKEILQTIDYPFLCGLVFVFKLKKEFTSYYHFYQGGNYFNIFENLELLMKIKFVFMGNKLHWYYNICIQKV